MSAGLPPVRVAEPAFMAAWPRGIRPASVRVADGAARLLFVHPDAGWVEAWVRVGGGCQIGASKGFSDDALQRLAVALRAHWTRDAPTSDGWLRQAMRHRAAALAAHGPPGAAGGRAQDLATRVLGVEDPVGALTGFASTGTAPRASSCAALACEAFLLGLAGRGPEARRLAQAAAARAVGMEHAPVARLLVALGADQAAADALSAGLREGAMPLPEVAWVAGRARRPALARVAVAELLAGESTATERRLALDGLLAAGDLDEARAFLEGWVEGAPSAELFERLAALHLWRLEVEPARAYAERAGDTPEAALTLGALRVLAGEHVEALGELARIDGDPGVTARLWRMRALLELGRVDGAVALAKVGAYAERPAWKLWRAYADAQADPAAALHGKESYQVRILLEEIHGEKRVAEAYAEDAEALALLRATLARLGGNYGPLATWLEKGALTLAGLRSPRERAVDAQLAIPATGLEAALAELERQTEAMPSSPFPRTYRAELSLWTGAYAEAERAFAAIWEETRTRWGYVGLGAARLFLGRPTDALAAWEAGLEHYDYLPAEATYAYRGEAYLALGRLEAARTELEHATAQSPSRVGAWAALARVRVRLGDGPGAREALDRMAERAPALAAVAAERVALPFASTDLEAMGALAAAALAALGGNRASKVFTFRDGEGRSCALRAVPPRHWLELGRQLSPLARDLQCLALPFAPAEG